MLRTQLRLCQPSSYLKRFLTWLDLNIILNERVKEERIYITPFTALFRAILLQWISASSVAAQRQNISWPSLKPMSPRNCLLTIMLARLNASIETPWFCLSHRHFAPIVLQYGRVTVCLCRWVCVYECLSTSLCIGLFVRIYQWRFYIGAWGLNPSPNQEKRMVYPPNSKSD